jgi:hypothetical protein
MKTHLFRLLFCLMAVMPVGLTVLPGCQHPPSERVVAVRTLTAAGVAAKAAIDGAAELYLHGKLTQAQWDRVAAFYDHKFQPAFRAAVIAAETDLSREAAPQILSLLAELTQLAKGN